jgi:hypothetical protein
MYEKASMNVEKCTELRAQGSGNEWERGRNGEKKDKRQKEKDKSKAKTKIKVTSRSLTEITLCVDKSNEE